MDTTHITYTLHSIHCIHFALRTAHYARHNPPNFYTLRTLHTHTTHYTRHAIRHTTYDTHSLLHTAHCTQCALHTALCTARSLHTAHCTLYSSPHYALTRSQPPPKRLSMAANVSSSQPTASALPTQEQGVALAYREQLQQRNARLQQQRQMGKVVLLIDAKEAVRPPVERERESYSVDLDVVNRGIHPSVP
jgi:hypothetical protein